MFISNNDIYTKYYVYYLNGKKLVSMVAVSNQFLTTYV